MAREEQKNSEKRVELAMQKAEEAMLGIRLEREGVAAMEKFQYQETEGLLAAMRSVYPLVKFENERLSLEQYPATSPLLALQVGLDKIREQVLKGHALRVSNIIFRPDGQSLVTAGEDASLRLWNLSGKELAKSNWDGQAPIWNLSVQELGYLKQGNVRNVSSPNGQFIATSISNGIVKLLDLSGKELTQFKGHQGDVFSIAFSPNGEYIATGGSDSTVRIWSLSGKELFNFRGHEGSVWSVVFSPDGKFIATCGDDNTARIWNVADSSFTHTKSIDRITFSSDSQYAITHSSNDTHKIWDLSGQEITQLQEYRRINTSSMSSPDNILNAEYVDNGLVRISNKSGDKITQIKGYTGRVLSAISSADSKIIATRGDDGIVIIWDWSGKELTRIKVSKGNIVSSVFSPDSKSIATRGDDKITRVWDLSGRQIAQYDGRGYINSDWTTIATINQSPTNPNNQIVTLRPLLPRTPTALLDRACQKLKYYILQSPELKDDRKMCGFES